VHTANIAQVKRMSGLDVKKAYNRDSDEIVARLWYSWKRYNCSIKKNQC